MKSKCPAATLQERPQEKDVPLIWRARNAVQREIVSPLYKKLTARRSCRPILWDVIVEYGFFQCKCFPFHQGTEAFKRNAQQIKSGKISRVLKKS